MERPVNPQRGAHPGDPAELATETYRRCVRDLLTELAAQAGAPEPEVLARQLHLLYDGAGQSARLDHDPAAADAASAERHWRTHMEVVGRGLLRDDMGAKAVVDLFG